MQMKVPFLDLKSHHAPLLDEINAAIQEVIESGAFAGGPFVVGFESDFAAFIAIVRMPSAPAAARRHSGWPFLALGIGPGDEVITVPNTFIATAEAITYCGATPVFVDVDERTYTMDPAALEKAITARTKAIIPVHLFGRPADMDPILEVARAHGLFVLSRMPARLMEPNTKDERSARSATQLVSAFTPERILAHSVRPAQL
jgi:dTDP-4-amino-4,6-dideoxygalactose transaminase